MCLAQVLLGLLLWLSYCLKGYAKSTCLHEGDINYKISYKATNIKKTIFFKLQNWATTINTLMINSKCETEAEWLLHDSVDN